MIRWNRLAATEEGIFEVDRQLWKINVISEDGFPVSGEIVEAGDQSKAIEADGGFSVNRSGASFWLPIGVRKKGEKGVKIQRNQRRRKGIHAQTSDRPCFSLPDYLANHGVAIHGAPLELSPSPSLVAEHGPAVQHHHHHSPIQSPTNHQCLRRRHQSPPLRHHPTPSIHHRHITILRRAPTLRATACRQACRRRPPHRTTRPPPC
ncbi:hypothetical protein U1Q18_006363 [Sarracenia purpurea var. burkii]